MTFRGQWRALLGRGERSEVSRDSWPRKSVSGLRGAGNRTGEKEAGPQNNVRRAKRRTFKPECEIGAGAKRKQNRRQKKKKNWRWWAENWRGGGERDTWWHARITC